MIVLYATIRTYVLTIPNYLSQERKMKKVLLACAIVAMSMAAYAGEIVNKDSVDYDVQLAYSNWTKTVPVHRYSSFSSSDVKAGVVAKMVKSGQTFTVGSDNVVVIENGKMRKK